MARQTNFTLQVNICDNGYLAISSVSVTHNANNASDSGTSVTQRNSISNTHTSSTAPFMIRNEIHDNTVNRENNSSSQTQARTMMDDGILYTATVPDHDCDGQRVEMVQTAGSWLRRMGDNFNDLYETAETAPTCSVYR